MFLVVLVEMMIQKRRKRSLTLLSSPDESHREVPFQDRATSMLQPMKLSKSCFVSLTASYLTIARSIVMCLQLRLSITFLHAKVVVSSLFNTTYNLFCLRHQSVNGP